MKNFDLSQDIAVNSVGEYDAIRGYYELLDHVQLDDGDRLLIEGIIKEEKKHAEILKVLAYKYDGQIQAEALPKGLNEDDIIEKEGC